MTQQEEQQQKRRSMALVNEHFLKLPGNYLFSDIAKKVNTYKVTHPKEKIIRLGIGDVTQPLAPAIIEAMHKAVDEMAVQETFRGYGPEQGKKRYWKYWRYSSSRQQRWSYRSGLPGLHRLERDGCKGRQS